MVTQSHTRVFLIRECPFNIVTYATSNELNKCIVFVQLLSSKKYTTFHNGGGLNPQTMSPNRPICCLRTVLACRPIVCRPKNNSPKRDTSFAQLVFRPTV